MTTQQPATATLTVHGSVDEVTSIAQRLNGGPGAPGPSVERLQELLGAESDLNEVAAALTAFGFWKEGQKLPTLKASLAKARAELDAQAVLMVGLRKRSLAPEGANAAAIIEAIDKALASVPQAPSVEVVGEPASVAAEAPPAPPANLEPITQTWTGAPEPGKRVVVTYLHTGEMVEGNVREVDPDKARFTFGKWGAPDHIAADGRTAWALTAGSYPPGLSKATHEAHKKELRAKRVPFAQISPWRTHDEIEAGTWAPPTEESPEEAAAGVSSSEATPQAAVGQLSLPEVGSVVCVVNANTGNLGVQGLVVGHTSDGFELCAVGEFAREFKAVESTWSPRQAYEWPEDLAVGDLVLTHNGGKGVEGTVTGIDVKDVWGYPGIEYMPKGANSAMSPSRAFFGRYGVTVLRKATPVPTPAPTPSPAPVTVMPSFVAQPLEWAQAQPLAEQRTGAQALAWLDHGGWPPSGPGRVEVVTLLAFNGREVMVQLASGATSTVDVFDLKQVS